MYKFKKKIILYLFINQFLLFYLTHICLLFENEWKKGNREQSTRLKTRSLMQKINDLFY